MKKTAQNRESGFTLIELMVAITISVIIGIVVISNYRAFGEDQNLKSAVLDIQSQLRAAQANASTNVKCDTQYGAAWQVELNSTTVKLKCQDPPPATSATDKKTLTLETNIAIQPSVTGTGSNCPSALPFIVGFALLKGNIDLGDPDCTALTITLKNSKTNNTKSLNIEQSGRIYAD